MGQENLLCKNKNITVFADSDISLVMEKIKTIRPSYKDDINKEIIEWIYQRRNEIVPLTGAIITAEAKMFHAEMKGETPCEYSPSWLEK